MLRVPFMFFVDALAARWRKDLRFRVWAAVLLSVTLAGVFSTVIAIESMRISAEAELRDRVSNLASIVSKALARPLFDINTLAIQSVGDAIGRDPEVLRLRVWGSDGSELVNTGATRVQDSRAITVNRDVVYASAERTFVVGKIELTVSGATISRKLQWQVVQASISGLVLILAISLSVFLVSRRLTQPFSDIVYALEQLNQGDTAVKLSGMARDDQIGVLSRAVERFKNGLNELRVAEQRSATLLAEKSRFADRLDAIYNGSNDAVMLLTDRGFFDCNKRALEMFGMSHRAELIGLHFSDLSLAGDRGANSTFHAADRAIERGFQTGEYRFEWAFKRLDGSHFPAEVLLSAFDYDGERVLQSTVRDITERKRIEQELHDLNNDLEVRIALRTQELQATVSMLAQSKQKLQGIVDTALDAVVRVDAEGSVVGWNRQAEVIFGWSSREALGRQLQDTIVPSAYRNRHVLGMNRYMSTHMTTVVDRRIEISALHRSGREFPIELAITRVNLEDPNQFEFCAFIRDITLRKQAEDEIRTSLAQQRELNQLKSRFVAMASHEFRTPLATIMSSKDLLQHYADRLPVTERDVLFQSIGTSVKRMTKMLEDILTIGQGESRQVEFSPSLVELLPFLSKLVQQVRPDTEDAGEAYQRIKLSISDSNAHAWLDERLMQHMFENLLSNALKYSPQGTQVQFHVECDPSEWVFTVADQGIGIPQEDISRLFESFHRATNVGTIPGTGLGLAIVKHSVDLHAGRIEVTSTLGQGTTFTVALPRVAPST
ncbi:PAS domain-containing sensor histidine kinase [Rhodoferax aquaticus]|uniref:histidine kinase n=1 Tax=Rhodoferax aquaticus TaxID=2527691 RepID=A0A515EQ05_9BURK|nr:PAS domain-containing sensor histidine kinase [Rhodoferax aquaticus]QDL54752.1 PAS domain S-box protein [Rhodoferax aquaticus]